MDAGIDLRMVQINRLIIGTGEQIKLMRLVNGGQDAARRILILMIATTPAPMASRPQIAVAWSNFQTDPGRIDQMVECAGRGGVRPR